MTRIAILALCALFALTAAAEARPSTTRMTCDEAQDFVSWRGAVVMSTGPDTYERIVASRAYCMPTQVLKQFYAPTLDVYQCRVGYRCIERVLRHSRSRK